MDPWADYLASRRSAASHDARGSSDGTVGDQRGASSLPSGMGAEFSNAREVWATASGGVSPYGWGLPRPRPGYPEASMPAAFPFGADVPGGCGCGNLGNPMYPTFLATGPPNRAPLPPELPPDGGRGLMFPAEARTSAPSLSSYGRPPSTFAPAPPTTSSPFCSGRPTSGSLPFTFASSSPSASVPSGANPLRGDAAQRGSGASVFGSPFLSGAADAAASLDPNIRPGGTSSAKVASAFEVLGVQSPPTPSHMPDQAERFIAALTGDKRSIPVWSGQPNTLRTWLKMLAYWETDNPLPRAKWGIKLYQSLQENSEARRLADQFELKDLLSVNGYSLILTAIMDKYRPYLEVAVPAAIDKFFYHGERQKGQSFASFLAQKETARMELENHLQEKLSSRVAGRILLRQAGLSEYQRELLALRNYNVLLTFEQVAELLRPLDRPELIAQAAGAELGQQASKHYPVMALDSNAEGENDKDGDDECDDEDEEEEDSVEDEFEDLNEGEVYFEDREYQEDEMQYVQAYHSAYADVRAQLRDQRKQRGFTKLRNKSVPAGNRPRSGDRGASKGRGRNRGKGEGSRFNKQKSGPFGKGSQNVMKGTPEDLVARTRCFNCQELGHLARDCPLKGGGKGSGTAKRAFVVCRGSGQTSTTVLFQHSVPDATADSPNFVYVTGLGQDNATELSNLVRVYAGVKVRGFEALVDTAAEDGVIGDRALSQLTKELRKYNLQPVEVKNMRSVPCAGIGGAATIVRTVDVPTSLAGQQGVLRMTVLQDSDNFATPPLLPISYLEAVKSVIDLERDELRLPGGLGTPMTRLVSGHRAVDILQFHRSEWQLPEEFLHDGQDPFRIDPLAANPSSGATSVWSVAASSDTAPPRLAWQTLTSPLHCFSDAVGVQAFVKHQDGSLSSLGVVPGWQQTLLPPGRFPRGSEFALEPQRYHLSIDAQGHVQHIYDDWTDPSQASRAVAFQWRGRVFFRELPVVSSAFENSGNGVSVSSSASSAAAASNVSGSFHLGPSQSSSVAGYQSSPSSGFFGTGTSQNLSADSTACVEELAKDLLRADDFSEDGLLRLLKMLSPVKKSCRGVLRPKGVKGYSLVLGAFVHGGVSGVTTLTTSMPELCRYVNAWLLRVAGDSFQSWSSVHIGVQISSMPHIDKNNEPSSDNLTITIGSFTGGELWVEDKEAIGKMASERVVRGKRLWGYKVNTHMNAFVFSPKIIHASMKWTGFRTSITAYTTRTASQLSLPNLECLKSLNFPFESSQCENSVQCHFVGDHEDVGHQDVQCQFDFEQAFDHAENSATNATSWVKRMLSLASKWIFSANPRPARLPRGNGKPPAAGATHGRGGESGTKGTATSQNGHYEDVGIVEAYDHRDFDVVDYGEAADGGGTHCSPSRRSGGGEHRAQPQEEGERQGDQRETQGPDQSGHREPAGEKQSPSSVSEGGRGVQPPGGRTSMSRECVGEVVDVRKVRFEVESTRRDSEAGVFVEHNGDRGRQGGQAHRTSRTRVSTVSSSAPSSSGTGGSPSDLWSPRTSSGNHTSGGPSRPRDDGEAGRTPGGTYLEEAIVAAKGHNSSTNGTPSCTTIQDTDQNVEARDVRAECWGDQVGRGDGQSQRRRHRRFLIEGRALEEHSGKVLDEFKNTAYQRGILLKAFLVLFTVSGGLGVELRRDMFEDSVSLGRPTWVGGWNASDQTWVLDNVASAQMSPNNCYEVFVQIFPEDRPVDWIADCDGVSAELSKGEVKNLLGHLRNRCGVRDQEPNTIAGVINLADGWSFRDRFARQEAMRLLREHRPAVVLLTAGSHSDNWQWVAQVAKIQQDGGRGFVLEIPDHSVTKRPQWKQLAQKLQELPHAKTVWLQGQEYNLKHSQAQPVLVTNLQEAASALQRRCNGPPTSRRPWFEGSKLPSVFHDQMFVGVLLRALRETLPLRHYPVFHRPDQWDRPQGDLRCCHFVPRYRLALPSECQAFSTTKMRFTGQCVTHQHFVDGSVREVRDVWTSVQQGPSSGLAWTGFTIFQVEPEIILPDDYRQAASWAAKSVAHAFHSFITREKAFQQDWRHVFPSHKNLGRSEATASASASTFDLDEFLDNVETATGPKGSKRAMNDDERVVKAELRDLPVPSASPKVPSRLAPDLKREVYRIHRNLGHPERASFARALKHAGAREDVLKYVKQEFECPICCARKRPASHRPAHVVRAMPFNDVLGVDLIFYRKKVLLNMLDWGTNFQVVKEIVDKTAESVVQALLQEWFAHYGVPRLIIADQGKEFINSKFCDVVSDAGAIIHFTDVRSPWQNARTEKAGGLFKERLAKICDEALAEGEEEFSLAVSEAVFAHNRYADKSGFSPQQRVFGSNLRLPSTMIAEDYIDAELLANPQTDYMKRAQEIREIAAKAWVSRQDIESVKRAAKANTRTADAKDFVPGEVVYVWRDTASFTGWSGPGLVIATSSNGRSLWISVRGYLVKASREQVRSATSEESLGVELAQVLSAQMLDQLEHGNLRNYKDVQCEGGPLAAEGEELPKEPIIVNASDGPHSGELAPIQAPAELGQEFNPEELEEYSPSLPDLEPIQEVEEEMPSQEDESTRMPSNAASRRPSSLGSVRVDEATSGTMHFGPVRQTSTSSQSSMPYPFVDPPVAWPPAPGRSTYLEVVDDMHDKSDGARYWTERVHGRRQPLATKPQVSFDGHSSQAFFSKNDRRFYLAKKKESPGQVTFSLLGEEEKKIFRQSRDKEILSLLESGAIKILSLEESDRFRREHPRHVLTSRYVDRWKPTEAFAVLPEDFNANQPGVHRAQVAPKSRWCVVGWKDPQVFEIERAAPTPLSSSIYLFLQVSACRNWDVYAKDAKTAFLQARPTTRKQKLACTMPADECFPGYHKDQLILLLTEVYGLVSGPSWWRRSLLEVLVKEFRYRVSAYDKCVLSLDGQADDEDPSKTQGLIVIEVDDILESGSARHRRNMQLLEQRLRFGKIVKLRDHPEGTAYAGRRIMQLHDGSVMYTMADYIANRLKAVKIERKVLKKDADKLFLTEDETSQMRGALATINWVAREGRPDVAAAASVLAGKFPRPKMSDLHQVNDIVEHLKTHHVVLKIHSIKEGDIRHLIISDSSFDPSGKTKPQHGWLQALTTPDLNAGRAAPVSLVGWTSRRLRRKAGNTLLCESIALSTALGAAEKQMCMWKSFCISRFSPRAEVEPSDEELGLKSTDTVIAKESANFRDPLTIGVVDAKSLFDGANSEQAHGDDDRSALEIAIIHESLGKLLGRMRWIPHNRNPADALTKLTGAHMAPMMLLLKANEFMIEEEGDVLQQGRQAVHRMKVKA